MSSVLLRQNILSGSFSRYFIGIRQVLQEEAGAELLEMTWLKLYTSSKLRAPVPRMKMGQSA